MHMLTFYMKNNKIKMWQKLHRLTATEFGDKNGDWVCRLFNGLLMGMRTFFALRPFRRTLHLYNPFYFPLFFNICHQGMHPGTLLQDAL